MHFQDAGHEPPSVRIRPGPSGSVRPSVRPGPSALFLRLNSEVTVMYWLCIGGVMRREYSMDDCLGSSDANLTIVISKVRSPQPSQIISPKQRIDGVAHPCSPPLHSGVQHRRRPSARSGRGACVGCEFSAHKGSPSLQDGWDYGHGFRRCCRSDSTGSVHRVHNWFPRAVRAGREAHSFARWFDRRRYFHL